jgi:acetyl/propionyl-CoA carboxylase alpha subunit
MQYRFQSGGKVYTISFDSAGREFQALIDGITYQIEVLDEKPGQISLLFNGRPTVIYWAIDGSQKWISLDGCTYLLEKPPSFLAQRGGKATNEDILRAPMPAQVRVLQISAGDWLEKGQTMMILEAMKMEIRIQAPRAARVVRLLVNEGQSIERNQVLAELRQEES